MSDSGAVFLVLVLGVLYFAPTLVAASNGHPSVGAIAALNLLLGWTFVGWVAALVWALVPQRSIKVIPAPAEPKRSPAPAVADELAKMASLRDQGVLTADEFEGQKRRLLTRL